MHFFSGIRNKATNGSPVIKIYLTTCDKSVFQPFAGALNARFCSRDRETFQAGVLGLVHAFQIAQFDYFLVLSG